VKGELKGVLRRKGKKNHPDPPLQKEGNKKEIKDYFK
jgi:hypothetical protein